MYVMMRPISSMCPASMMVGAPFGFTTARLLPATSFETSANAPASSRQTRAGADSNPEGPGVSRSRFRKAMEDSESMRVHWENDDPLHLNRGRRGSAVRTIRHRRRRGDRPRVAPRGPYDAAHSHRHIARGAPAPGGCARCVGVLPEGSARPAHRAPARARAVSRRVLRGESRADAHTGAAQAR